MTMLLLKRCLFAGTIQRLNRFRHWRPYYDRFRSGTKNKLLYRYCIQCLWEGCGDAVLTGGRYDNLLASFDALCQPSVLL